MAHDVTGLTGTRSTDLHKARLMLGVEVRKLRKARGLTLAALAAASGRSTSFLSSLERGRTHASVEDLQRLALTLCVPLGWFLAIHTRPLAEINRVIRAQDRRELAGWSSCLREQLLSPDVGGVFQMRWGVMDPGASHASSPKATQEQCFVVSGVIALWLGDDCFSLAQGDSFGFISEPYRWMNTGQVEAIVVWVTASIPALKRQSSKKH